ncbi:ankyrin repeat domain-containing protein [Polaribacter sp. WD7]|uniref:ankyrin repeat domain-containing protein n=1 Tax=Polaribacter sp. WD7 TaxID=2269061 RepID=UPI000DF14970|nr:ankyrin repeat domain-containing protein [Polaribacter sp. WD7]RCS26317.1 ankyrin repeat domain-containing protein [Polaribacter sp. WD7]
MKKLFLTLAIFATTFSTVNATSINDEPTRKVIVSDITYDVSAFCKLIQLGKYESVKALIEAGENVNQRSNGLTPLMFAARQNRAKIVQLLIDNGANVNAKCSSNKMTALDMAKRSKAVDAIKILNKATKN